MKKYLILVQRKSRSGATYVARKTVYANSKEAAAEELTRMLGVKIQPTKVIDVQKAIAENKEKIEAAIKPVEADAEESKVELSEDIKGEIQLEDKPAE